MREVEQQHRFEFPWKVLTFANWNKYPNEHASHVASVDIISRNIAPDGKLITHRLLQLKQPIPSIFKKLGIPYPESAYFLEMSVLDPQTQQFEATSVSLSMRNFVRAKETCCFSPDPESGGTLFLQKASFTAFSFFAKIIEEVAVNRFEANSARGRHGLESVIEKISTEIENFALGAKDFETRVASKVKEGIVGLEKEYSTKINEVEHQFKNTLTAVEKKIDVTINAVEQSLFHEIDAANPFC
ncbi:hypothetical protein HDV01_007731 [Terramyces sp. JEL0728]|nr:hypothetical protein HDV01_007731 [Terramyces sp. JEL0728]